jgi:hypothetical protein
MSRSGGSDLLRAVAVLLAAVAQFAAGALGGVGALFGESVGEVARSYPNPLLPDGAAFMIWNVIYLAVLAVAVWQLLPGQRTEEVHRRSGWQIAIACTLNAVWVLLFSAEQVVASQIVIVCLLVALAMAWSRAARAEEGTRHWPLFVTLGLYTGWVAVATVVGALTTLAAVTSDGAGTALAVVALAVTAVAAVWVVTGALAVAAFTASVLWALAWIAVGADATVAAAAVAAALLVAVALLVRLARRGDRARAAFG